MPKSSIMSPNDYFLEQLYQQMMVCMGPWHYYLMNPRVPGQMISTMRDPLAPQLDGLQTQLENVLFTGE